MKKIFFVLWFLCCTNKLFAIEALLGVSAYTLSKYRWEVELMNMGGYEVIVPYSRPLNKSIIVFNNIILYLNRYEYK